MNIYFSTLSWLEGNNSKALIIRIFGFLQRIYCMIIILHYNDCFLRVASINLFTPVAC